ncbi:MAG TPA: transglycosylase SLT domain-containing protein [Burkholderiales bacterium]|nr:transglycosylase SLT domain-containing protein [Burkholderiales bacterium]
MEATRNTIFRIPLVSTGVRVLSLARGVFALVGLLVVLAVTLPAPREFLVEQAGAMVRSEDTTSDASPIAAGAFRAPDNPGLAEHEQRAVADFIAKRYRVSDQAVAGFVATAYRAGRRFAVDPLLILAVMAIESRYNPVAESNVGAMGLMQVLPKFHQDKLSEHGGDDALLDPVVNIEVGTQILREYLKRFGETETALQVYAGAIDEPTSQYASKVLAERSRLKQVQDRVRRPG